MKGVLCTVLALAYAAAPQGERPDDVLTQSIDRAYARALERSRAGARDIRPTLDHSTWASPWIIRTKNYELRMAGQRSRAVRLAEDAELMLPIYQQLLETDLLPREPLQIRVFPSTTLYNEFGNDHSDTRSSIFGGYFDPANADGAAAMVADENLTLQRMYLTHATAQQYLFAVTGDRNLAASVSQGIGAYMQTFWAYDFMVRQFESYRDAGQLFDLGALLGAGIDSYSDRPAIRLNQLAMTFLYLRNFKAETRSTFDGNRRIEKGAFDAYVAKSIQGKSLADDPIQRLLSTETRALQDEILAFRGWR